MARTILFDFAQGGGSTITDGTVYLAPTQMRTSGSTVILPSTDSAELVDGAAQIPNVEPSSTAGTYQIRVESSDRRVHTWIVNIPDGTAPITFSLSWALESWTLPLAATGVQVEQWIQSVRSHATAANSNAVNALQGVEDLEAIVDGLAPGGGGGGSGLPTGGATGQVLAKKSATNFDVQWITAPTGGGGPVEIPFKLVQSDPLRPVLEIHGKLGEPHQTTNSNLVEFRNGVPSDGDPTVGRLVTYINEEGLLRVQNSLNNKTIFRIRQWGTNCNAIQLTNDTGSVVLFNVRADDGHVTAPNIGEPIRGILNAGEQPAPGMPEGIYLRRAS